MIAKVKNTVKSRFTEGSITSWHIGAHAVRPYERTACARVYEGIYETPVDETVGAGLSYAPEGIMSVRCRRRGLKTAAVRRWGPKPRLTSSQLN